MAPPARSAGSPAAAGRPKWSRWRKVFAVIGALILVFVGVYVVYAYLDGLPPTVAATHGSGQIFLDVALMTFYTPSVPGATDFSVSVSVTFANGFRVPFEWANVSGAGLPVRFVLTPSDGFLPGPSNGFVYADAGPGATTVGVTGPQPPGAIVTVWSMQYSVREMSVWQGFSESAWLEVDYTLTPVTIVIGAHLPTANVSVPTASDLLPAGVTDDMNLTVEPGYLWTLNRGLANFTAPSSPFRHSLPAVAFDAGSRGVFTASLTSAFQWAKGDAYRVTMTGSGTTHGSVTWYWDARFGSLDPVFSP